MYNRPPSGKTVTGAKPVINLKNISIQGMTKEVQIMTNYDKIFLSCRRGLGLLHGWRG